MSTNREICNTLHYGGNGIPEGHLEAVRALTAKEGRQGIDWELFHNQRMELVRLLNDDRKTPFVPTPETPFLLDGVLNLLDWMQDLAAAAGVFTYPTKACGVVHGRLQRIGRPDKHCTLPKGKHP